MVDNKFDLNIKDQDGFRKFIEYEAATLIISLLEKGSVDEDKAGKLSQITLDLIIPGMTVEELYLSGVKLDDHDPELAPVVYKIMKIYEEKFEIQENLLTNPDESVKYISKSKVDLLAVSVGNFHGMGTSGESPHLKLGRLAEIKNKILIIFIACVFIPHKVNLYVERDIIL